MSKASGGSRPHGPVVSRLRLIGLAAVAISVAGVAVWILGAPKSEALYPKASAPARKLKALRPAVAASGCELRRFASEGEARTTKPVRYRSNPPHSGDHAPEPMSVGVYETEPPVERLVHSLYHGRVLIWFRPGLPARIRGGLRDLYGEDRYHLILTPHSEMPFQVAATAWRVRLGCRKVTGRTYDALRAFRDRYRDRAPEFIP